MPCLFHRPKQIVRPLSKFEAWKALGKDANPNDIYQAQKLFTCEHGVTLDWKQARAALGFGFGTEN